MNGFDFFALLLFKCWALRFATCGCLFKIHCNHFFPAYAESGLNEVEILFSLQKRKTDFRNSLGVNGNPTSFCAVKIGFRPTAAYNLIFLNT